MIRGQSMVRRVRRRSLRAIAAAYLLAVSACGGGGGGAARTSVGTGSVGLQTKWQQPGGGISAQLPAAVRTVRLVFESQDGYACCVAIHPEDVPPDASGNRSVLFDKVPDGPAT